MAADVFVYEGANPPGLDVLSAHGNVLWKHPQHGWLKVDKGGGSFTPIGEADAQRLIGTAPTPTPTPTPAPTPTPGAQLGGVGAGTTNLNQARRSSAEELGREQQRVKAEKGVLDALAQEKFQGAARPDPLAGLGLVERAKVQELIRGGMTPEEAVKKVRKPAAATQAEGLKP